MSTRHTLVIIWGEEMYIIQIADLHVGSENGTSTSEEDIIKKSIRKIQDLVPKNEKILLCVCGDLIDSKGLAAGDKATATERLNAAIGFLKMYYSELERDYAVYIQMCAGNHDITHLDELEDSASSLGENFTKMKLRNGYFFKEETENTYFLFLNSCHKDQYSVGRIDYTALNFMLKDIPPEADKVLVMHHTIMSMDDQDNSSILNAAKLLGIIEENNICGVLHGHIHGRNILTIGKNECKIIGTGALFSRNNPDVNSQFNIIHYQNGIFSEIHNCRYNADTVGSDDRWDDLDIGYIECQNYFSNLSIKEVYDQLLKELSIVSTLYNVVLHINSDYNEFKRDLRKFLHDDAITIGTKRFDYFTLAEMWERVTVPDDLYFNHGQCFSIDGIHRIDEIANQLKNKPTSSRAILTTCDMQTIKQSSENRKSELLPSLMSIQFSKDNSGNTLYVHMHLRALEASRFLKINICEIDFLLNRLIERGIQFETIDITLSAFRVQKKEKFNCFIKADIDNETTKDLTVIVALGDMDRLCQMLTEKSDSTETITHSEGIQNLYDSMISSNKLGGKIEYSENVISIIKDILEDYSKLDEIHKRRSTGSEEEENCENAINAKIKDLIDKLMNLKVEAEVK